MFADVRRWGNSLAVRIPATLAESLGIKEGDQVKVQVTKVPKGKVDVSGAPFFRSKDGRTDISENHDEFVYQASWENLQRKKRSWNDEGR